MSLFIDVNVASIIMIINNNNNNKGITNAHPRANDEKWSDNLWNLSIQFVENIKIDL